MITFASLCKLPRLTHGCIWNGYTIIRGRKPDTVSSWTARDANGKTAFTARTAGRLAEKIHAAVTAAKEQA